MKMATIQEQIDALKAALATGTKSVTIGDRAIVYRDTKEIAQILSRLETEKAAQGGTTSLPFGVLTVTYSKGL